jgi:pyruvate kinase
MNLLWGVQPVRRNQACSAEDMAAIAEQELLGRNCVKTGDVLGVVAGTQMASGSTNFLRLHVVTAEGGRRTSPRSKGRRAREKQ